MDPNTLRRAFNDISDRPRLLVRALAGLGALYDLDLIGCSPIGDTLGTSRDIQFGSLPCNPPSDTPSHETRGATEEKETTSGPFVQEAKTRTVTDGAKNRKDNTKESLTGAMEKTEAKKHEDDDKKKWREFRLEDDEIFSKIKKISEALGLETPCSRHGTKHHVLVKILLGLEKDLAKKRNIAGAIAAKNAPKASTASDAEKVRTPCPHGGATVFKDTSTPPPLKEQTMSLHEGVTRANNPSSSQQPSPREQADNRSVGPNNMITLNSVRPTSKGPPDNENVDIVTEDENEDCEGRRSASTDSGAENEQTTSLQKAAAEEVAAEKRAAESQTKSLPIRAPSRRHQGLKPENEGLPNSRPKKKIIDKNILTERPAPSQNIDKQATEIETANKPANIDKPASVNETVEKTTGNGPTHNGNRTASDNNRHSHNNEPVIPHAPGAPLTFRDQNTDNFLAEKPANMNIDEPATVNETVEKTTGNGPTHNGNKTASDNNRHSHNDEPVLQHAPGAPSTFLSENPKPPYRGRNGQIVSKSRYDEQQANDRIREQAGTTLVGDINQYGISRGLEKIALSPEDLNRGRGHRDEKMWEASADALHVERIFSAETYACLLRQLAYYFTSDHLVSNAHASELYCRDDGFTIRDLMSWNRMQGITLQELTEFIGAVPGLYFRSSEEDDYMNVNWDDVYDSYSGLSDDLNEMSDDDKKKYLLKNADQDELNEIYWDETITCWNEEKLLDFTVFSRKLVGSEGGDSDGACGIGFASL